VGFYVVIAVLVGYLISVGWAYRYWEHHRSVCEIDLCPEEAQIIFPMIFLWFFYWDSIGIIMRNADKKVKTTNLKLVQREQ